MADVYTRPCGDPEPHAAQGHRFLIGLDSASTGVLAALAP
jgi:hypothetical protein